VGLEPTRPFGQRFLRPADLRSGPGFAGAWDPIWDPNLVRGLALAGIFWGILTLTVLAIAEAATTATYTKQLTTGQALRAIDRLGRDLDVRRVRQPSLRVMHVAVTEHDPHFDWIEMNGEGFDTADYTLTVRKTSSGRLRVWEPMAGAFIPVVTGPSDASSNIGSAQWQRRVRFAAPWAGGAKRPGRPNGDVRTRSTGPRPV
jgi:hypothetical protein